ncbi:hypothetical protein ROZALSC1DRAFT_26046, partial [Rozella allomycis CSF55]
MGKIKKKVVASVVPNLSHSLILGTPFLRSINGIMDFQSSSFKFGPNQSKSHSIPMFLSKPNSNSFSKNINNLCVAKNCILSPKSETVVDCLVSSKNNRIFVSSDPSVSSGHLHIACGIIDIQGPICQVIVCNSSDDALVFLPGMHIGKYEPSNNDEWVEVSNDNNSDEVNLVSTANNCEEDFQNLLSSLDKQSNLDHNQKASLIDLCQKYCQAFVRSDSQSSVCKV